MYMDWEVLNECEKSDISRLKALYRNMQTGNLDNPVKTKQVGSF